MTRDGYPRSLRGANPRPREPDPSQTSPLPKPTGYEHTQVRVGIPKELPLRSRSYLDFIRSRPCHHCAARPVEAAHFAPKGDGGGMGTKADDRRTVPQCASCHGYWHQHGRLPSTPLHYTPQGEHSREASEWLMLREQVRCLIAWWDLRRGSE